MEFQSFPGPSVWTVDCSLKNNSLYGDSRSAVSRRYPRSDAASGVLTAPFKIPRHSSQLVWRWCISAGSHQAPYQLLKVGPCSHRRVRLCSAGGADGKSRRYSTPICCTDRRGIPGTIELRGMFTVQYPHSVARGACFPQLGTKL